MISNKIYIRSSSAISPQRSFGDVPFMGELVTYDQPRLTAIEPDYKQFIDPKQSRRMSRVIRMGIAAAKDALQQAGIAMPDAIVTGTAYGCVEDTGIFLSRMIEMGEEMLSPTAFIQSTHNTVAAQIALLLQCHAYNNTFVHKSFSFESALQDAAMLLNEGEADNILIGGIDEITDFNFAIFNRFNIFKKGQFSNTELYTVNSPGTIAGEGAAFFVVSDNPGPGAVCLDAFRTCYKPKDISQNIIDFLNEQQLQVQDIDLVISGRNGDACTDEPLIDLERNLFSENALTYYKHLCGEYPVASSFALWLATNIIKTASVPPAINPELAGLAPKRVLICNNYQNKYWSLMLVSAC